MKNDLKLCVAMQTYQLTATDCSFVTGDENYRSTKNYVNRCKLAA